MIAIETLNKLPGLELIKFSDHRAARLAEIIVEETFEQDKIDDDALHRIKTRLIEHHKLKAAYHLTRNHLLEMNRVLSKLEGLYTSVMFFDRVSKTLRPTVISPNFDEASLRIEIRRISNETANLVQSTTHIEADELYVRLLIEIAVTTGLPQPRAEDLLSTLLVSPFENTVVLSSVRNSNPSKCLSVIPSNLTKMLCTCLNAQNYSKPSNSKLAKTTVPKVLGLNKDCHVKNVKLKSLYKAAASLFCIFTAEPIIYSRLNGLSLPVAPPWADFENSILGLPSHKISIRERIARTQTPKDLASQKQDNAKYSSTNANLDEEEKQRRFNVWQALAYYYLGHLKRWIRNQILEGVKSKNIEIASVLNKLTLRESSKISAYLAQKNRCTSSYVEDIIYAIEGRTQSVLKSLRPDDFPNIKITPLTEDELGGHCAISLMFAFAYDQLVVRKNAPNTVFAKLSSIFSQALFCYEPALFIEEWDDEDSNLFIFEELINPELAPNTNQSRLSQFATLLSFCRNTLGVWNDVSFPVSRSGQITTTNRHHILGQQEFNLFLNKLPDFEEVRLDSTISSVIYKTLFYAGFRPGELIQLRLGDIVAHSDKEIFIAVRRFKTPASRRTIPLHLLAPPDVCKEIFDYISSRYKLFLELKGTRASGKDRIPSAKRQELLLRANVSDKEAKTLNRFPLISDGETTLRLARMDMKLVLGEGADLYLLRHCYASHMFLRWYAMKYPDVIEDLRDRNEWFYSDEAMKLQRLIYRHGDQVDPSRETDMIHLMKSMGHQFVDTFFAVYCHSYFIAYRHSQKKYLQKRGWENLSVKAGFIQANFPKMKSRTSVAQIQTKTLAGVLDFFSTRLG
ncbi:hypothetical protein MSP8887_00573 [Marinomonas spartinae]|uniref:hypothetical protein n=1 Tax=Marinomonas spartinae TaxID=1792290 RepID=UPI000808B7E7|nr:hypothetical protein [Marinomonas spartinae]SBS27209.1 hypothetical protein MSP8887_00573 [Marinomonas spartinae]